MKLVKELDTDQGIGLIEKKSLGLGKPNVIYVKNFMVKDDFHLSEQDSISVNDRAAQEGAEINAGCIEATAPEETSGMYLPEVEVKESEESTSRVEIERIDVYGMIGWKLSGCLMCRCKLAKLFFM